MTRFTTLDEAHAALRDTVAAVPAGAWDQPTPCAAWNVTQAVRHAALDQIAFAAAQGKAPQPAENPFEPSPEPIADALAYLDAALDTAAAAWTDVDPAAAGVPTPVPPGAMTGRDAALAAALDAAVHAWDVAVATGQPSPLSEETAAALQPLAEAIVEPLRAFGANATAAERLLAHLGRDPRWTA